jgi:hypothetical protein
MAENGEIAQAFAPQHRKLQAFMVTFSQHFRVLLENFKIVKALFYYFGKDRRWHRNSNHF